MTWRAIIIGMALLVFMCWGDVLAGISRGYGWTTEGHFPDSAVFLLVFVVLVVGVGLRMLKRRWGLKQAEMMLIWCMLIIGSVIPSTGLMRFWLPMLAAPSYVASRPDIQWRSTSLDACPADLLISKDPKSVVVQQFYEGVGKERRVPWGHWLPPMASWLVYMGALQLSVIFLLAMLRRQWVDREHLLFPLARVPLDFTEGGNIARRLPDVFYNRAFLIGFLGGAAFRLFRAIPVFAGGTTTWALSLPLADVLKDTPLEHMYMANVQLWWSTIGFAYLVPADVSLSIWLFYFFGRFELQTASWFGSTLHVGGSWSPLMKWQQAGSYLAFTVGALFMTRRHLADVVRKAIGMGADVDDSAEPVSFRTAFWGFVICGLASVGWMVFHEMRLLAALTFFLVLLCIHLVHARLVCQSGLYATWLIWSPSEVLHSLSFGTLFGPAGAVIANMQPRVFMHNITLGPAMMHSFRISEVFTRRRRWIMPVLMVALVTAVAVSSWTFLDEAYYRGALNFSSQWGMRTNAESAFSSAHNIIQRPFQTADPQWLPFGLGILLTGLVMFMRARFYWWPVHSIGLLTISNWSADRMWLPFLIGWLTKIALMKFGSGRALRQTRVFFIGLILAEGSVYCIATIIRAITKGALARF